MRLAKIKNKYMYKGDNGEGHHHYLVFYNRKEKRYNAIQLTHLYLKDKDRFGGVKKGFIKIEKFKEFYVPSGVKNEVIKHNVDGLKIDLKNKNVINISKRYISKKQRTRIMRFINKKKP